jgi:hypothetical protein
MEPWETVHRGSLDVPLPEFQSALTVLDGFGGWATCFNSGPTAWQSTVEIADNAVWGLDDLPGENTDVEANSGFTVLEGFGGWERCLNGTSPIIDAAEIPDNAVGSMTLIEQVLTLEQSS